MLEEGGDAPGEGCGCPSHPLTIYRGKGRGGHPLKMDLEEGAAARGNPRWVWGAPTPRKLAPQAGRGGCPWGGAPTSPGYVRWGGRGAQPLSGLMCPLPLAHKAPPTLAGASETPFGHAGRHPVPPEQFRTPYPSSNISIFTAGSFRNSS